MSLCPALSGGKGAGLEPQGFTLNGFPATTIFSASSERHAPWSMCGLVRKEA